MLFLFSDVGEMDAPTRIRVGSHIDIARILAPARDKGLTLGELAAHRFDETAHHEEVLATGESGTVIFVTHSLFMRLNPIVERARALWLSLHFCPLDCLTFTGHLSIIRPWRFLFQALNLAA